MHLMVEKKCAFLKTNSNDNKRCLITYGVLLYSLLLMNIFYKKNRNFKLWKTSIFTNTWLYSNKNIHIKSSLYITKYVLNVLLTSYVEFFLLLFKVFILVTIPENRNCRKNYFYIKLWFSFFSCNFMPIKYKTYVFWSAVNLYECGKTLHMRGNKKLCIYITSGI